MMVLYTTSQLRLNKFSLQFQRALQFNCEHQVRAGHQGLWFYYTRGLNKAPQFQRPLQFNYEHELAIEDYDGIIHVSA